MISKRRIFCGFLLLANSLVLQADELSDLLQAGQTSLASGHYREADNQLAKAQLKAVEQENGYSLVLIKALQGYMALQRQNNSQAEKNLVAALAEAKQNNWTDLVVRIDLYLAQFYQHLQDQEQGDYYLQQAVTTPEKVSDKSLLVSGYYQLAKRAIENQQPKQAAQQLQSAKALMLNLPESPNNSQLWLNIAYQSLQLYFASPQADFLTEAFTNLNTALTQARQNQQPRIQSAALKHLASLYKQQQRTDEATKLLLEGINLAQKEDASDLLIDLEWQIGQLYQQQKQQLLAIAAYRRAVKHIDSIRIDIPVSYQKGRSSFRDTFAPIYLALADLLLQQSSGVKGAEQQVLLIEAQDSIERMKKTELEDYFQNRCDISATPINLKKTDIHAAALYPISLADRLEIIVYTSEGLQRFTSKVTAKNFEKQARLLASNLRNYADFSQSKTQAQVLYQWLLAPANAYLKQHQIETLIYMPDGALRLVPLAALYDGKKFVIQDYAVVTSPGMSLIDSDSFDRKNSMLLAGMSLPGNVVSDLPEALLADLVAATPEKGANRSVTRDLKRSVNPALKRELSVAQQEEKTRELHELLKKPLVLESLQHLLALPGVDTEIKQLAEQNHTAYLLNESFSLQNFIQILQEQPHDTLHIASHGFFGATAEESFIMTHDKILNLNQLEALLSSDYFKLHPIDLLTLSACQTAEGDDRSPLGISGVAIKAKVHSALGSLWPVADEATAQLMTTFYQSMNKPQQTKAKALQEAMLGILAQKNFASPSFWSPFILIGNWM